MKKYLEPEMEVTLFENTDVITASTPIELPDDEFNFVF